MSVELLTEHHLEFLSLRGGCRGSSESTHVKMPHCWKSHVTPHITGIPASASDTTLFDSSGRGGEGREPFIEVGEFSLFYFI